jgi:hypothetical protein
MTAIFPDQCLLTKQKKIIAKKNKAEKINAQLIDTNS